MTCAQAEDLMGAYALDALDTEETDAFDRHLAGCAEHRQLAQRLRETASLLALTAEEREPSPDLRRRILETIRSDAPEPALRPEPVPVVVPIRRDPRLPRWAPRPAFAAMAAGILLALGAGTYAGYRMGQRNTPLAPNGQAVAYRFQGGMQAPTALANLVYLPDKHQAVLAVKGLPLLRAGQVYEMWLITKNGLPIDEGVSAAPDGRIAALMDADLAQYAQFVITIEPGERAIPSSPAILEGQLDRSA
ncbi:MAG TPA: anti-sigma factor [Candidatus Dormibacteraeota bacterium]|jgi:anti-sigma factor RsiW